MEKGGEKNDSSNLQKENMIMESIKIEIKADLLLKLEIMIVGNSESQEEEDKKKIVEMVQNIDLNIEETRKE